MGSPPHTRGRCGKGRDRLLLLGFTPAYAGKIFYTARGCRCSWVHPRIRGEDLISRLRGFGVLGSPPHTRGRFFLFGIRRPLRGFTPAYAGKIPDVPGNASGDEVHPRIRGEDCATGLGSTVEQGSPPHTRGRLRHRVGQYGRAGFTPAYAGKIGLTHFVVLDDEVHPRIRGEDYPRSYGVFRQMGSPPHTRGRFVPYSTAGVSGGFTPAYAGKISPDGRRQRARKVHPRIRGEDFNSPILNLTS